MAVQWSFVIASEDLTDDEKKRYVKDAISAGLRRAELTKAIVSAAEAKVRQAEIVADFGAGVGGWLTMPLAAVGTPYSVLATAVPAAITPQLANNRVAIFYSVSVETAPSPVDLLSFREGAAAGTTLAVFDLEALATKLVPEGYFTEPIIYDPQRVLNIVVTCRIATGARARVRLGCFIVEPGGPVISY